MKVQGQTRGNPYHDERGRFTTGPSSSSLIVLSPKGINREIWDQSVKKLEELQAELPQVNKLIKEYVGHGIAIQADPFLPDTEHTEVLADGDFNPLTGIISINTLLRLSDKNNTEQIAKACEKSGTFGKFGRALSSKNTMHTAVHEYGHATLLALCQKKDPKNSLGLYSSGRLATELIEKVCNQTGISYLQFTHSLSSVASKNSKEAFSEAFANAILASQEGNKTSQKLLELIKEELK